VKQDSNLVTIETPEHIEIEFIIAGIGSRCVAYVVDRLIQVGLVIALVAVLVLIAYVGSRVHDLTHALDEVLKWLGSWVVAVGILGYGLISLGYFVFFEYLWNGSTPGKSLQNLRVVKRDGRPISFLDSAIRNVLRAVDILGDVYPLGLVVMFFDARHRRLGDFAAGTMVISETQASVPQLQPPRAEPMESAVGMRAMVAGMSPHEYQLLRKFIARREGMEPDHRKRLAREICDRITGGTGLPEGYKDPEAFLLSLETLYGDRIRVL
jgi:uncharacterized RDD family membrane protein YckC